ncbi:class I SAM-dependent methyltransferase [Thalassoglobus sp. JC818]|uniref:class I SAM-dependent methyltransferase n=1 Tax=Thalassoglobus sp. JC818 TaxID=3232136 RepID=UPI003459B385
MHDLKPTDGDKSIDWGKTSRDYAIHRPGPPASFFRRLSAFDIGLAGQRILDLGTGTGVMARQFAKQGANVTGVDVSREQIEMAKQLASEEGLSVEFAVHSAESLPWQQPTFDVVAANQCWLYFDTDKVVRELRRILKPDGLLVTSHFCWLPRVDKIAHASEQLVLKFNPDWGGADWSGNIPACPAWAEADFDVQAMFYYDEPIPFTREGWCGRFRACRGVGATLSETEVNEFNTAHIDLLNRTVPESFNVLHRLDAHVFVLRNPTH